CVNQDIVDKLQQLKELHEAKRGTEERWRVYAYGRAIGALRKYPKRITSYAEARKISGVGEKTAQKIMEILDTGELKRIETENTEDVKVTALFRGIYGVGSQTAFQWYAAGCKTLDDVRARKGGIKVSSVQELGLKYYDGKSRTIRTPPSLIALRGPMISRHQRSYAPR
ncbi:DNA polymerase beta, N-terminal domain-like protein, partial [Gloeophyllum trabeum ATCC 11539]